jgi:peptide/nickel transport system permease protein
VTQSFVVDSLGRLAQSLLLILVAIVVVFLLIQAAPGDPLTALVGDFPVPEQYAAEMRGAYGLDKAPPERLLRYVGRVVQGDLGFSFKNRQPVTALLWERGKNTLILTGTALVFATIVGIWLGVVAARYRGSWIDGFVTSLAVVGYSVPVFWLAQIFVLFFALNLRLLPAQGMSSARETYTGLALWLNVGQHLILPALVLAFRYIAINARITRASMLEVLSREYVTTARAKGLAERVVLGRHALRNALLPVVTTLGLEVGLLFAGSALVETVFAWPGIGRLLFDSIAARDYPVIQGIFLLVTVWVVAANWLTDTLYRVLDPRIRVG